jgi:hypothetical protein
MSVINFKEVRKIDFPVDVFRDPVKELNLSIDGSYTMYYDESNNCRKFCIKEQSFNVPAEEDFVLAGVGYENNQTPSYDFNQLWSDLRLQKNVKEIKFSKHFPSGDFLNCMLSKRTEKFLEWLDNSGLFIHCSHINNLFYSIVDIVDSITDLDDITLFGFDINSLKNVVYKLFLSNSCKFFEIMKKYKYPNIQADEIENFCNELILLFGSSYDLNNEEKFIKGMLRKAKDEGTLVFLQDNEDSILQENYVNLYMHAFMLFKNSEHIFDEETEIFKSLNTYNVKDGSTELSNYKFVKSESEPLVQVSDVISGLLGKFFIYVNTNVHIDFLRIKSSLSELQRKNIKLFYKILMDSQNKNPAFMHHIASYTELDKINDFFEILG